MRVVLAVSLLLTGCTTTFYGSPKVTNGVAGCRATCDGWGMELAGMVKMGDYSDGCICQVKPAAATSKAEASDGASGSVIPPATGVFLQMQAQANAAASGAAAAQQAASSRQTQQSYGGPRR
jgi:hypothetical protein